MLFLSTKLCDRRMIVNTTAMCVSTQCFRIDNRKEYNLDEHAGPHVKLNIDGAALSTNIITCLREQLRERYRK